MRIVDRSRHLSYLRCPRERYNSYHRDGMGLAPELMSVPLMTGTHVHAGLALVLAGQSEDTAANTAVAAYKADADKAMAAMGTHPAHFDYVVAEQAALTEALIRAYCRRGLPRLKAEWEVLEVEAEYDWPLDEETTFMSRLDGLLRFKADGSLGVLSFKTASDTRDKLEDARIDLQGLTEPLAISTSGRLWQCSCGAGAKAEVSHESMECPDCGLPMSPAQPRLIKMEWLVKGKWKEEVAGSGLRFQDSWLVRPWRQLGAIGSQWAWQYFWTCPGTKHAILKADGKTWTCPGTSKTHGLGPSWTRVPVWESMTIKEWIDILDADSADPLSQVLLLPPAIERSLPEMLTAKRAISFKERRIADDLAALAANGPEALDVLFPKEGAWTGACDDHFGGRCPFYANCHNGADIAAMGFVPRIPNHPQELELIKQ